MELSNGQRSYKTRVNANNDLVSDGQLRSGSFHDVYGSGMTCGDLNDFTNRLELSPLQLLDRDWVTAHSTTPPRPRIPRIRIKLSRVAQEEQPNTLTLAITKRLHELSVNRSQYMGVYNAMNAEAMLQIVKTNCEMHADLGCRWDEENGICSELRCEGDDQYLVG